MNLYKGIFWYVPANAMLITRKVSCDENGVAIAEVEYTSKSGDNFNHKTEWTKFSKSVTGGHSYNYYPRGRVEIKNKRATVYLNPSICKSSVFKLIEIDFGILNSHIDVHIVPDGSRHYKFDADLYF